MMNKTNWILDAALFVAFVLAFWLDLTGLSLHQWLGVGISALIGVHLLLHWKWVVSVTKRFLTRTSNQARMYYVIDMALMAGLAVITITGLVISSWLNLPLVNYDGWRVLHVYTSVSTLVVLVLKIGLHWRWIVQTAKKYFSLEMPQPSSQSALAQYRTKPSQAVAAEKASQSGVTRKEFVRLMGLVGVSAFVSAFAVLNDELGFGQSSAEAATIEDNANFVASNLSADSSAAESVVAEGAAEPINGGPGNSPPPRQDGGFFQQAGPPSGPSASSNTTTASSSSSSTTTTQGSSQSSTSCTVRCNRGCSYPGHCRKYTDTNGNNLCDLGECV